MLFWIPLGGATEVFPDTLREAPFSEWAAPHFRWELSPSTGMAGARATA